MSGSLLLPHGFPRAPGKNGINRVVGQLKRVTLKFCKFYGCSMGVRQFIEQDLMEFVNKNPGVVVYLKPRRHHGPVAISEYLNGERHYMSMKNFTRDEVWKWLQHINTRVGTHNMKLLSYLYTTHPSVQGPWNPFINKDPKLYIYNYPTPELGIPANMPETATERLRQMFESQKLREYEDKELGDHMKIEIQR